MLTSIVKELLGTKLAECNEIIIAKTLIDDEYESSNTYSFSERIKKYFW